MKIFDINNPRHKSILREELNRAQNILVEAFAYSVDEIWDKMSKEDRDTAVYAAKVEDPDAIVGVSWDKVPYDIQDQLDLSEYELAKYDQAGRTNLRAIENYMKTVPNLGQLTGRFLARVGRDRKNDLTIKQSYQLLNAIQKFKESGSISNASSIDSTADDAAKRNFMDAERRAGRTSGLD
jgi:hypothetical protein